MIVVRAPFRLPLGGGGTDLPSYYKAFGGSLITAAINKYMYININRPAIIDYIKINYSKVEVVSPQNISSIKHDIVRNTLKYLNIDFPLEIGSMADLAAGTGMGSSSSYTVALLTGLNQLKRRYLHLQELAEEACKIEIDLCEKPIGKQDQYAATFGGIIHLDIDQLGNVKVTPLKLNTETIYELENRLLMFYTNIQRDANKILGEQSQKAKEKELSALEAMHKIKKIGEDVKNALLKGDVTAFGQLLHEHWQTKKNISGKMSNPQIDEWYELALQNGAIGGKVMGAGGGGFMLFCVEEGKRKQFRKVMENNGLKYMDFKFDFQGVKVLANV